MGSLSAVLFSAVNIQQNLINILSTILIYDLVAKPATGKLAYDS